ncbi:phosphotransferase [Kitasatospora viridis]|uniref:Phosphotransferase family enzyme n=1 Tax=Kitasatospora viridis TaxID=281105 RepID=A0A561UAC7_9ACTN|nr:phosphotransferase [Kitasatospora viridis]TWF96304.1 phosphotransferase family enzyme [Kitasatospora viridis]
MGMDSERAPHGPAVITAERPAPLIATNVRKAWLEMPTALRNSVEGALGAPIVRATTQSAGFSVGVAARLVAENGRTGFVKAVSAEPNADTPGLHRAEARISGALSALGSDGPAPLLLDVFESADWVALLYEDVDGKMPDVPWQPDELDRVLDAVTDLATRFDPSPVDVVPVGERLGDFYQGWRRMAAARDADPAAVDWLAPWALARLDELAAREADWTRAASGSALVHADLRADNILLTADRVVLVDWAWAARGARWFDLVAMLPCIHMQGGPPPAQVFDRHPVAQDADPEDVNTVLAACAGFFLWQGHQPPWPGLPTLPAFYKAQGDVALAWLRERCGW